MLFKRISLKKSITISVLIMLLLTAAMAIVGIHYQQQSLSGLQNLQAAALNEAALVAQIELAQRHYQSTLLWMGLVLLLTVLAGVSLYLLISRRVVRPMQTIATHFDMISAGDLTQRILVLTNNEVGAVFAALRRMQESLARTVSTVRKGIDEINGEIGRASCRVR